MTETPPVRSSRSAYIVVGSIFALAIVLGVIAYGRYKESERHIKAHLDELSARGAALSVEQCVTEVLDWHQHCEAMPTLCDGAIPMAMQHCLGSKDRTPYCDTLGHVETVAKWTFQKCSDRGIIRKGGSSRSVVKACGNAYSAIESFCAYDQKGVVL